MASSSEPFNPCTAATTASSPRQSVRIIAKIRGFTSTELKCFNGVSKPWISVNKPKGDSSETATISFSDQPSCRKESYEVGYCYEQDEDIDVIFSKEIKPLISGVFDGSNASVIAFGARGSGKTYTIQGYEDKLGLAEMAVNEILLMAEKEQKSVAISLYEIYQDHVYDVLAPERCVVSVMETRRGHIQLKGLSQIPVSSISEFQKLYSSAFSSKKLAEKFPIEAPRRSHKGLMVHVASCHENINAVLATKMHIIDLAGYEDVRRKSGDGFSFVESTKINKSLHALHNVVKALNANEDHVPYRESKLTRMLQDSLGGTNKLLMVACLNPSLCQDTISMVNLASRSHCSTGRSVTSSIKKEKSWTRPVLLSSSNKRDMLSAPAPAKKHTFLRKAFSQTETDPTTSTAKGRIHTEKRSTDTTFVGNRSISSKSRGTGTIPAAIGRKLSGKKAPGATCETKSMKISQKKDSRTTCTEKGRKLFQEASKFSKENSSPNVTSTIELSLPEKEEFTSDLQVTLLPLREEVILPTIPEVAAASDVIEHSDQSEETSTLVASNALELALVEDACSEHEKIEVTPTIERSIRSDPHEDEVAEQKNTIASVKIGASPPISARLRELSNNLKSLYTSPLCITLPLESTSASNHQACLETMEPKTPVLEHRVCDKRELASINSPWATFNTQSAGVKNVLIQDCMKFLNSASKDELKKLKGIGDKRATYILNLREDSPEFFKNIDDLQEIGLSAKQAKRMMKQVAGDLFS